ncbi:MAG: ABC transporter ATP-binding protein [Candidatus Nanoarchaeia archaeon]
MGEAVFKIRAISKSFGNQHVLDNISLDIFSGEIIGIIGESGAGKTTFLHTLIGFLQPDQGEIVFQDKDKANKDGSTSYLPVQKNQKRIKQLYGFASQNPSFYEELTVKENLQYFGVLHNLPKKVIESNTSAMLSLVGLERTKNRTAKKLSGGMSRRLDIACSLIHNPSILILDEPTADLDPLLRNQIWSLVKKINKKKTTVILSSHHLAELETICDRIIILKDNKILTIAKPEDLKKKYAVEKTLVVQTRPGNYFELQQELKNKGIVSTFKNGFLEITTDKAEKTVKEFIRISSKLHEELSYIEINAGSLDDVFVNLWDKRGRE